MFLQVAVERHVCLLECTVFEVVDLSMKFILQVSVDCRPASKSTCSRIHFAIFVSQLHVHLPQEFCWVVSWNTLKFEINTLFLHVQTDNAKPFLRCILMNKLISISTNRCMKPLVDWLSNPHWTADTGILTYLRIILSNGTQTNGDHSCPVKCCFKKIYLSSAALEKANGTRKLRSYS